MRSLSLRTRLFLWASVATSVPLVLIIALVDVTFRANIRAELEDGLTFAGQVADEARASQLDTHIHQTVTAALDTRLRAAVATGDPATVSQTLDEVRPPESSAWTAVVSTDGTVLAASAAAPRSELVSAGELLSEALYFDTADLWAVDGQLVEVAASAILFGASPLAVLVTGRPLDRPEVTELETTVGRPVALLIPGGVVLGDEASGIEGGGARLAGTFAAAEGEGSRTLDLGGETFLSAATPLLSRTGDTVGTAVLLASLDEALEPIDLLRIELIGIFLFGLGLIFLVAGFFSRLITVPVKRLLRETERLGGGDLEKPITPLRDDEIGRLAESFDDMRVSLRSARSEVIRAERLSAIGKAASAVAHDFAQPLSTITGAVGLLRFEESEEHRERCFEAIESALGRLQRMKREVVEFARGEVRLDEVRLRIDGFLENSVSGLRAKLAEDDIRLVVEHGYAGEWPIDNYRLARAIENLVRNAAAALGPDGSGTIAVESSLEDGDLVLKVIDDGPGIPPDIVDEIFEPFVTVGKKEGTGLGLAITRNVVEQHGGTIHVESGASGTCFTIILRGDADRPSEVTDRAEAAVS